MNSLCGGDPNNDASNASLSTPRQALEAAAEHIDYFVAARDRSAALERGAFERRCKEVVDHSRAKLEKVYRAYTKARERLVEALRAKEGAEADARELQQKYAVKAR